MGRIVVISNRVGSFSSVKANEGGLATAMKAALEEKEAVWFGWSGATAEREPGPTRLLREGRLTRALVDLQQGDYERYYVGFANRMLWPLFHYRVGLADFHRSDYEGYCRVNALFAERLAEIVRPDDLLWIHDYHLLPLASELRRRGAAQPLGFFLHIPFPAPEVLTTLPVHEDLVRALFDYDLVGFQTDTDLRSFADYIEREVGGTVSKRGIARAYGSEIRVGAFPIGIDTDAVAARAAQSAASPQAQRLRESLTGRDLVIGVDRLDYTKGLLRRFDAVERFFEKQAHYRRAVVVLQIAPPTRDDVAEYQQIRSELDGRIGRINGRFGEPDLLPVRYLNRHFSQERLFGFYRMSAVGLVTPLRDGMNLVAKEYVACQNPERPGALVLSRFAGAARELDAALIANPFDADAVANCLDRALSMPLDERRERHSAMMRVLQHHDIRHWRKTFLEALSQPLRCGDAPPPARIRAATAE